MKLTDLTGEESAMRRMLKIVLPIMLVFYLVEAGFSTWVIYSLERANQYERSEVGLQSVLDDIQEAVLQAEAHSTAFLLTGNSQSADNYHRALEAVGQAIENFKAIAPATKVPPDNIEQLDGMIRERIEAMNENLRLMEAESWTRPLGRRRIAAGDEATQMILARLKDLDFRSAREARAQQGFAQLNSKALNVALLIAEVATFLLIGAFAFLSRLEIRRRSRIERELLAAQDAAMIASKVKSQFLATVSHEIRTPLNGIIGLSEILRGRLQESENKRFAEIIYRSGTSLLRIVNDILDLSKAEAGKIEFEYGEMSVLEVVQSTSELFSAKAREKGLLLVNHVDAAIPEVLIGDGSRISQVLRNFVSNAIKFTPVGEIIVTARHRFRSGHKEMVRFQVADTGVGIERSNLPLLFQTFSQIHREKFDQAEGTGLGLSICKHFVEGMGGQVGVESSPGRGSQFWFEIPLKTLDRGASPSRKATNLKCTGALLLGKSAFLDQVMADYSAEFGIPIRCESELPADFDRGPGLFLVYVDSYSRGEFSDLVRNIERVSPRSTVLITKDPVGALDRYQGGAHFRGFLSCPFTRLQLTAVLNGEPNSTSVPAAVREIPRQDGLILLAEDNLTNQILAETVLSDLGYRVHVVNNGREVLDVIDQIHYDLILMDCQMPNMDGLECTRSIRRRETLTGARIPIVAMTANAMRSDRDGCLAAGMDDYISKPFRPGDLEAVLKKWIPENISSPITWSVLKELSRTTNDVVVKKLIQSFVGTLPEALTGLERAARDIDRESLRRLAHKLKSSSASLGAMSVHSLCEKLEVVAMETGHDEKLKEIAQKLCQEGDKALHALRNQKFYA